jgi:2-iminobutanoate/2-iminopropanoate deaminase
LADTAITYIAEPGAVEDALYSDTATAAGTVWTTQIPTAKDGSIPADIAGQSHQILANLRDALERAGSSMNHILHLTLYFTDLKERAVFNAIYREHFTNPRPVRCAVGVNELGIPGMKIELTAAAALRPVS